MKISEVKKLVIILLMLTFSLTVGACDMNFNDNGSGVETENYTLTIMVEGEGDIFVNEEKLDIEDESKEVNFEKDFEVKITADPAAGKQVTEFTVNDLNKIPELMTVPENQYIFAIDEDTKIEVIYEDQTDGLRTGMHLYGSDGVYLGKLTTDETHVDSVFNEYGDYGSPYSQTSIWNEYGPYGNDYSDKSAFNDYANNPPEMYYKGDFVGYVTTNSAKPYSLHPLDLYSFLEYHGF